MIKKLIQTILWTTAAISGIWLAEDWISGLRTLSEEIAATFTIVAIAIAIMYLTGALEEK